MKHADADLMLANARAQFEKAARLLQMEVADAARGSRMYSCSMLRTALQRFPEAEVLLLHIEVGRGLLGKRET
jgi:hypothetical protein